MPAPGAQVDVAFAALADRTRRGILEHVGREDVSIGELADRFAMTRTGVAKHVRVLEDAGLVGTRKEGRVRTVTVGPRRLDEIAGWIDAYRRAVDARLNRLEAFLERMPEEDPPA